MHLYLFSVNDIIGFSYDHDTPEVCLLKIFVMLTIGRSACINGFGF
jgi:hypothetical protein